MPQEFKKAYVVTVDMGYGHQRAVFPLRDFTDGEIINANKYAGIPKSDERKWEGGRKLYESISRLKSIPLIGDWITQLVICMNRQCSCCRYIE